MSFGTAQIDLSEKSPIRNFKKSPNVYNFSRKDCSHQIYSEKENILHEIDLLYVTTSFTIIVITT